jgi:hypothetical protein
MKYHWEKIKKERNNTSNKTLKPLWLFTIGNTILLRLKYQNNPELLMNTIGILSNPEEHFLYL